MSYDPNDPRLTAYALGELDAAEHDDLQTLLDGDPEALGEVEAIAALAALLSEELTQEPAALTAAQRLLLLDPEAAATASLDPATDPAAGPAAGALAAGPRLVGADLGAQADADALGASKDASARRSADAQAPAADDSGRAAPDQPPRAPARVLRFPSTGAAIFGGLAVAAAASFLVYSGLLTDGDKAPAIQVATAPDKPSFTLTSPPPSTPENGLVALGGQQGQPTVPQDPNAASSPDRLDNVTPSPSPATVEVNSPGYYPGTVDVHTMPSTGKIVATGEDLRLALKQADAPNEDAGRASGLKGKEKAAVDRQEIDRLNTLGYIANDTLVGGEGKGRYPANREGYDPIVDTPFLVALDNPLSTFSIDVDTAAYANVRRYLNQNSLPPVDAVRIEELINYFDYDYAPPRDEHPFSVHAEVTGCPWSPERRLLRIGLKAREIDVQQRPSSNLVFLIDVSGSMDEPTKLPLLKRSLSMLTERLGENDRVAIVVYAGASGLVLPSTTANHRAMILGALDRLHAGGSTNGGAGIELAYQIAAQHFIPGGVNRVLLATDGDFNVGVSGRGDLTRLIEAKARTGVFLSVLGFGMGNLQDSTLEQLADKGNGNYAVIDTWEEARKVLVEQLSGTLVAVAKDVKIQIEFNPSKVQGYRLIGYANRMLAAEDFNDDTKDAGEIGAGHAVTALYEIVPVGGVVPGAKATGRADVDPLKYQQPRAIEGDAAHLELLTLKLRYKLPDGDRSRLLEQPVNDPGRGLAEASPETKFAASVAAFGLLLRRAEHIGALTWDDAIELADVGQRHRDPHGYRAEFLTLLRKAKALSPR